MTLELAGRNVILTSMSGYVGLLSGDTEIAGVDRQPVNLMADVSRELRFGPVPEDVTVTGMGIYQQGERILTQPLEQPVTAERGQEILLDLQANARLG